MSPANLKIELAQRFRVVEDRIATACHRAGRARADVTLVAVTKSISLDLAQLVVDLGYRDLGESRPRELWRKRSALPSSVRWQLIGHLQRNMIERTLPVYRIHSVDRLSLLNALEDEASRRAISYTVLLQVNGSGEPSKQGFALDSMPHIIEQITHQKRHIRIAGLMTMAALSATPDQCHSTFATMRGLRDALRGRLSAPHSLDELSMGMSDDFEIAIEEGATLIRVGTALFQGLSQE